MHDLVRRLVEGASGQGVSEEAMINEVGDLTKYIRDKLSAANEAEKETGANEFDLRKIGKRPRRPAYFAPASGQQLAGGFFFVLVRLATVFGGLFRIPGLLSGHVPRIEMVLAVRILAGLFLIWIFSVVVGHEAVP